jgi:hypothetical protein
VFKVVTPCITELGRSVTFDDRVVNILSDANLPQGEQLGPAGEIEYFLSSVTPFISLSLPITTASLSCIPYVEVKRREVFNWLPNISYSVLPLVN